MAGFVHFSGKHQMNTTPQDDNAKCVAVELVQIANRSSISICQRIATLAKLACFRFVHFVVSNSNVAEFEEIMIRS